MRRSLAVNGAPLLVKRDTAGFNLDLLADDYSVAGLFLFGLRDLGEFLFCD